MRGMQAEVVRDEIGEICKSQITKGLPVSCEEHRLWYMRKEKLLICITEVNVTITCVF
jgi:uncharacterized protein YneR